MHWTPSDKFGPGLRTKAEPDLLGSEDEATTSPGTDSEGVRTMHSGCFCLYACVSIQTIGARHVVVFMLVRTGRN